MIGPFKDQSHHCRDLVGVCVCVSVRIYLSSASIRTIYATTTLEAWRTGETEAVASVCVCVCVLVCVCVRMCVSKNTIGKSPRCKGGWEVSESTEKETHRYIYIHTNTNTETQRSPGARKGGVALDLCVCMGVCVYGGVFLQ